uniref:RluA family pseudouridine synthase n=1 Tax=Oculatella sp. LEGE 06141 TaxID=1828648 RepID=UPI001D14CE29|nr:RluA family pseudouridine synthase [Oculatella sp. LEGE 06141]
MSDSPVAYWYEGRSPQNGDRLRLPRTPLAEAIARGLMHHLCADEPCEGKMYGVLLVKTPSGEQRVLKAFSGLLNGNSRVDGWVPPIPGRDQVALEEARTLAQLDALKQELIALQHLPERQQYGISRQSFETHLHTLALIHRQRKGDRHHQRQQMSITLSGQTLALALEPLEEQSRRDGMERRQLKRQRDAALHPLQQVVEQADQRMHELKQQRKQLSRQLQSLMHSTYSLTNFLGTSLSIQQLMPHGSIPTGTGDCCAPKLLHYAAVQGLVPLAMAEFWWGAASTNGDKIQGEFYGACTERCQPLMGFLLSGLPQRPTEPLRFGRPTPFYHSTSAQERGTEQSGLSVTDGQALAILYEDQWIIAVNKPAGLLSVPGRYSDRQDSVLSRLRQWRSDGMALVPVHRLDQDTSGILLVARDLPSYRQLSQQFQQRQIYKEYEAILAGVIRVDRGVIELPLWADPDDRPYQKVDWQRGKPSTTRFQVVERNQHSTRVVFMPVTGRTHQLRVHAADPNGLGLPIWGDRLYGSAIGTDRLYLQAKKLCFEHPQTGQRLQFHAEPPF